MTKGFSNISESFFSSGEFVEAWCRNVEGQYRPFVLTVRGSGPPRLMFGTSTLDRYGLQSISLGPCGFYASPGWDSDLEKRTLERIVRRLRRPNIRNFVWNVRFDHDPLAIGLGRLGLQSRRTSTHVLNLSLDYEKVFAGYNATIRNQVRRVHRLGVIVRETNRFEHLRAYYDIHMQRVQKGGYSFIFPYAFLHELMRIGDVARFLIAETRGRIIGGGLFLRDGCSLFYLHGAYDEQYSDHFPSCGIIDKAIHWACENGLTTFNFGGSGGITSLEKFKSFWGAQLQSNWSFEWANPIWSRLAEIRGAVRNAISPKKS